MQPDCVIAKTKPNAKMQQLRNVLSLLLCFMVSPISLRFTVCGLMLPSSSMFEPPYDLLLAVLWPRAVHSRTSRNLINFCDTYRTLPGPEHSSPDSV